MEDEKIEARKKEINHDIFISAKNAIECLEQLYFNISIKQNEFYSTMIYSDWMIKGKSGEMIKNIQGYVEAKKCKHYPSNSPGRGPY